MSDLISRAEAIKVVADQYMFEASIDNRYASEDIKDYIEIAKDLLKDIPSVEPSRLHCVNCKYYNYEFECMMWHNTHIRPYEDYCSRLEPSEFVELRGAE